MLEQVLGWVNEMFTLLWSLFLSPVQDGTFYHKLFSAVLVCGGLSAARRPDGILNRLYERLNLHCRGNAVPHIPKLVAYPLLLCEVCMGSLWGLLAYWGLLPDLFILMCGAAFLNLLLSAWLAKTEAVRDGNTRRDPVRHHSTGEGAGGQR